MDLNIVSGGMKGWVLDYIVKLKLIDEDKFCKKEKILYIWMDIVLFFFYFMVLFVFFVYIVDLLFKYK